MYDELKLPFLFNCWKHHKKFIRQRIVEYTCLGEDGFYTLKKELKQIGESQTDLYLGELQPFEIASEIFYLLKKDGIYEERGYAAWIKSGKTFHQILTLKDGSFWALRLGTEPGRYIHFHPGRYSPLTIRVKAMLLKTAIAVLVRAGIYKGQPDDLPVINEVRKFFFAAPPLKNLLPGKGVIKIIELLR